MSIQLLPKRMGGRRAFAVEVLEPRQMLTSVIDMANPVELKAGVIPWAVTAGDWNGDRIVDLAVANFGEAPPAGDVSVFLGTGGGEFSSESRYKANNKPAGIHHDDIDGDGDMDLLVSNVDSADVSVLLNQGDGTFPIDSPTYHVGTFPAGLATGDVNNDGHKDIVVAVQSGTVQLLRGEGGGEFGPRETIAVGIGTQTLALADFDQNGRLDVAYDNRNSDSISILLQDDGGNFLDAVEYSANIGPKPTSLTTGDLDNDGNLDIVVANFGGHDVSVLMGKGNGSFEDATRFRTGHRPNGVAIADLDLDGDSDIAVNILNSSVNILANEGGTFVAPERIVLRSGLTNNLTAADLNQDGIPDLAVVANRGVAVLLNATEVEGASQVGDSNRDGVFNQTDIVQILQGAKYLTGEPAIWEEGDWNGDGFFDQLDIVAALSGGNYSPGNQQAKGGKPGNPGGGGDDVGDQPCVIFDDVVGQSVTSDGGPYCHNKKDKIGVGLSQSPSHLRLETNASGKSGAGREMFVDFGADVELSNGDVITTTAENPSGSISAIHGTVFVGDGQDDVDLFNMGLNDPNENVNLGIRVHFSFTDGSSDGLLIRFVPNARDNGRDCPSSDPVTVTYVGIESGLHKWRVATQDTVNGACISRSGEGEFGETNLLMSVDNGVQEPGHIALDFSFTITASA